MNIQHYIRLDRDFPPLLSGDNHGIIMESTKNVTICSGNKFLRGEKRKEGIISRFFLFVWIDKNNEEE